MLSTEERNDILLLSRGPARLTNEDRRIEEVFTAAAAAHPDAEAVVCGDDRLSYGELCTQASEIADRLRAAGLRPGSVAAFCLPRSPQAVCTMLAILSCRSAFLPLDERLPPARRSQLLELAGAEMLVTSQDIVRLPPRGSRSDAGPVPETAAYVLFTSGSTGVPKAVCVPHCAVLRLVSDVDYMDLDANTRLLQLAPLAFDACMLEIWGALLNGGTLVIHPEDVPELAELGRTIARHGVTTAWLSASFFNRVIDTAPEILRPLRQLLTGGEALSVPHVVRALAALPGTTLINGYGPTEAATFTTTFTVPRSFDPAEARVPIGRPLPNTQVYVMDERRQLQPVGVPGEICISGDGLALGYLGDDALTTEKFTPDTLAGGAGARLYRTGDRGRLLANGNLDVLGRLDDQVKIRGFRVEPGEVQSVIAQHPLVRDVVVIARNEDPVSRRLVAYVVTRGGSAVPDLRPYLLERLPDYMIPADIIVLDALPMLPSGKLDRLALPTLSSRHSAHPTGIAPRTPTEVALAGIWSHVLRLERVGVEDDFFQAGGHSLLALQLQHQLNSAFATQLPLRLLFEHPTVAGQAKEIERRRDAVERLASLAANPLLVALRHGGSKPPFFLVAGGFGGEAELLIYAGLVRHFDGDRPLYGLRIRGVDELTEPRASIEEIAAEQLVEIRSLQPHGPYFIGGSCIGGVVALEIAQQLSSQGETVAALVLIDSVWPSWGWYLRNQLTGLWHNEVLPLKRLFWEAPMRFGTALIDRVKSAVMPSTEQRVGRQKMRIGRAYLRRTLAYAARSYLGPITYLRCEEQGGRDPMRRWRDLARGGLEIHVVPGDHDTHLREHAAATAARLTACLDAACGRCPPAAAPERELLSARAGQMSDR
jgi:amino acid adenylation domain-containing protein